MQSKATGTSLASVVFKNLMPSKQMGDDRRLGRKRMEQVGRTHRCALTLTHKYTRITTHIGVHVRSHTYTMIYYGYYQPNCCLRDVSGQGVP